LERPKTVLLNNNNSKTKTTAAIKKVPFKIGHLQGIVCAIRLFNMQLGKVVKAYKLTDNFNHLKSAVRFRTFWIATINTRASIETKDRQFTAGRKKGSINLLRGRVHLLIPERLN